MRIKIDHIDKIEGHMGFEAALYNGNAQEAFTDVIEGARLIEGMIMGRPYEDVPIITARICGVCPVVHNLASIKALEAVLGVKPSDIAVLFRKLLLLGEIIQSHILHIFFLSAPDFLGDTNDFNLIKKYPKEAEMAFLARDFATKIMKIVGGRAVHPIASEVGGFKILPDKKTLEEILREAESALSASIAIFKWINKIKLPDFGIELRPISLTNNEYEFYDGRIVSGQGLNIGLEKFYHSIHELQKPKSPVKQAELYNRHYLVGALSRLLNQSKMLNPEAKKLFEKLPQEKIKVNPFYNLFAQAAETVHCVEETEKIIKKLLSLNIPREDRQEIKLRAGEGIGAVEAPRGTLIHYYKLDKNGKVLESNIITPTAQFLNDLEHSLKAYLPQVSGLPEAERAQKIKALVRAYDPCISCATH
jgi:sulfhydrogenase subunit alpha